MPEIKRNKKATFGYEIVESYDAGIVLSGAEVKSVKGGNIQLEGSHIMIDKADQAWVQGMKIARYSKSGADQADYNPGRPRRLLLNKREIIQIKGKLSGKGLTIVPLSVYTTPSLVKVKIAIVRGKRQIDKRQTIKEREFIRRLNSRVKHS